jgi:hypothetical protein
MTLPNDSILVTPGSGATLATHLVSSKEYEGVVLCTEGGHIYGSVPTFIALTGISSFAASAFHFVLFNNNATAIVKVMLVVFLPTTTVRTGAMSGDWTLRHRRAPTTAPSGAAVTIESLDSGDTLPTSITAHNKPTTSPAGGTTHTFNILKPQPDEIKLTTLDAPGMMALFPFGGLTIFSAQALWPGKGIVLRQDQDLELQQDGTAGTGEGRILCIFTAEG